MKIISSYLSWVSKAKEGLKKQKILTLLSFYSFALAVSLVPLVIVLEFQSGMKNIPAGLIFFPAVILSSWYGGLKPGILTTIVSAILIKYFFLTPHGLFFVPDTVSLIQIFLFLAEGISISFFIDIGTRQETIKEYKLREKTYQDHVAALEKKYSLMEDEIKSRDEFLSIASHELKTPLTSLLIQIQTVLYNIRNVSFAQFSVGYLLKMLESAEHQSKRLSRMINDLLNVSLITTGRMDLELEDTDLSEVVKDALEGFTARLERENYELNLQVQEKIQGQFDKVRIEQAVGNLISNAIKYGNGKPITVAVSKRDHMGRIIVADQGLGISKKEQKNIFGLFKRATQAPEYKGLGVGLFITHQIVKAHNGGIHVKSEEGKGSIFAIELPLKNSQPKSAHAS